ncbi:TPA: hypothetical protein L4597_004622 [Pseudomonas aeruginosa]|nr:hypothetical protein U769_24717 [Pseudomonas aeruginosa MTB-1]PNU09735.1 hypothetical protein C2M06_22905 [Pseudomonas aeruginosa]HBO5760352.1 hypothetical protein [Pseudomonas aeruginosa]HBO5802405.1 hypothetical protein [Pseudomonas aeruginosa]HBP1193352.1 hypothetical protein [Pseudomonas aeruginosa]
MSQAAKIPANEYSLGKGRGYINIWPVKDGAQEFLIHNDGPNGATCSLKGTLRDNKGVVRSPYSTTSCLLSITQAGLLSVSIKREANSPSCSAWCGPRVWFEGAYSVPPKGCYYMQIRKKTRRMLDMIEKEELDAARALSSKLLSDCAAELAYPAKIYLTNILAMISAEKGENARCLEYANWVQKQIPVRDDGQPAEDLLPAEHAFALEQRAKADALSERCNGEK